MRRYATVVSSYGKNRLIIAREDTDSNTVSFGHFIKKFRDGDSYYAFMPKTTSSEFPANEFKEVILRYLSEEFIHSGVSFSHATLEGTNCELRIDGWGYVFIHHKGYRPYELTHKDACDLFTSLFTAEFK